MSSAKLSWDSRVNFGTCAVVMAVIIIRWLIKERWRRVRVGCLVGALLTYAWFHTWIHDYVMWFLSVIVVLLVVNFVDFYIQLVFVQMNFYWMPILIFFDINITGAGNGLK